MKLSFSQLILSLAGTVCLLSCNNSYAQSLPPGTQGNTIYDDGTLWISSSNLYHDGTNVGIGGVTSPQGSLHIRSASNSSIYMDRAGNVIPWVSTKAIIGLETFAPGILPPGLMFRISGDGGSTYNTPLFLNYNGNIGIRTLYPMHTLHVVGNQETSVYFERENTPWDQTKIKLGISGNGGPAGLRFQITPDNWTTEFDNALFIGNNGRVGTGTTIPQGQHHIETDASDKALYFTNRVSGTVNPVAAYVKLAKPTNSNDANRLSFYTTNDGGTNSREAMTLHKNGHVSINFQNNTLTGSNPGYEAYNELEVWGQTTVFGQLNIKNPGNNTIEAKITSGGVMTLREVNVNVDMIPPDYVFEEDYDLMSLEKLKSYIESNNHLPGVPPASEMEGGVNVGELQFKLLEKVEELTLYTLQLKEEIDLLKAQNEQLKEQLK